MTGARIRAGLIDFIGLFVVAAILRFELFDRGNTAVVVRPGMPVPSGFYDGVYETLGLVVVLNVLYHAGMELTVGRSIGKRLTGLRVVSIYGGAPTTRQTIVRNLARVIDILPNLYIVAVILVNSDPERSQRLGDRIARTTVQWAKT